MDDIVLENKKKYMKPPTSEQIKDFIEELGISQMQFERFYGFPTRGLTHVLADKRTLPPRFWHFVYEKIKPAYGVGYISDFGSTKVSTVPHKESKNSIQDNHGRLSSL